MFKRVRWIGVGAALGAWGSRWAQVRLRRSAQRYRAVEVGNRVGFKVRGVGAEVRGALAEGRQAMTDREAELRSKLVGVARVDDAVPARRRR